MLSLIEYLFQFGQNASLTYGGSIDMILFFRPLELTNLETLKAFSQNTWIILAEANSVEFDFCQVFFNIKKNNLDLQKSCVNSAENSCVLFTQLPKCDHLL